MTEHDTEVQRLRDDARFLEESIIEVERANVRLQRERDEALQKLEWASKEISRLKRRRQAAGSEPASSG